MIAYFAASRSSEFGLIALLGVNHSACSSENGDIERAAKIQVSCHHPFIRDDSVVGSVDWFSKNRTVVHLEMGEEGAKQSKEPAQSISFQILYLIRER